jgi:uncharacterized OB-fold protein
MIDLAQLKVPGPIDNELTKPFWQAASKGLFIIQCCSQCNSFVFYPRGRCPHCWADALVWTQASGKGSLKSYSVVHKPGHPGWLPAAPYIVGLVQLEEGPTMLSHILLTHNKTPKVGDALHFQSQSIGERILPCFKTNDI